MPLTLKSAGEKGVDRCKPNFNAIWERHGLWCAKNRVDIFCRLSTMHKRDRQTDKRTDHGTVTSIPIGEIAFSDVAEKHDLFEYDAGINLRYC